MISVTMSWLTIDTIQAEKNWMVDLFYLLYLYASYPAPGLELACKECRNMTCPNDISISLHTQPTQCFFLMPIAEQTVPYNGSQ